MRRPASQSHSRNRVRISLPTLPCVSESSRRATSSERDPHAGPRLWDLVGESDRTDAMLARDDLALNETRNMVNAGIDEKLAMKIGGWKTDSVFRRDRIAR